MEKVFKDAFRAHATLVTIALDNDELVRALRKRREYLRKIKFVAKDGILLEIENLVEYAMEIEQNRSALGNLMAVLGIRGIPEFVRRIQQLEEKIKTLCEREYSVTNVFCTFEKEINQRKVLSELSVGRLDIQRSKSLKLKENQFFRGTRVLQVEESGKLSSSVKEQ